MGLEKTIKARALDILGAVGFIGDWSSYGWTQLLVAGLLIIGVVTGHVRFLRAIQLFAENALIVAAFVFVAVRAEKLRLRVR
ncbi:hypothetical protein [Paraburkholderia fungorum]|uniref:hypothetical protein n=1 Tax=Paraburkholderia fungorum TaxID=134537 RepID=UPI00161265C5|nr:hypothetical protein [Paraburkholderia fungorum]MBB5547389.1 hypothetical protein [Paraburkholderia fungorum]